MPKSLASVLDDGLKQLGLSADPDQKKQLLDYVKLLLKHNEEINLTGTRDPEQFLIRHVLDSLTAVPFLEGATKAIDIGTGGGVPGIPLAIMLPDIMFILNESKRKKVDTLKSILAELKLPNVAVLHKNALEIDEKFDTLLFRGFGPIDRITPVLAKICAREGIAIIYKGKRETIDVEIKAVNPKRYTTQIDQVRTPFLDEERHIVILGAL